LPLSCDINNSNTCDKDIQTLISIKDPRGFVVIDNATYISSTNDNNVHIYDKNNKKIQELSFNKNEYAIGITYDQNYGLFLGIRNTDDETKSRIRN